MVSGGLSCDGSSNLAIKDVQLSSFVVDGKETCNADTGKDYWLIEIASSSSVRQQYGDTITLNGVKYVNVIKSTGLSESLKVVGEKVGFDFNITSVATSTSGCSVDAPKTYKLKVANTINSGRSSFREIKNSLGRVCF